MLSRGKLCSKFSKQTDATRTPLQRSCHVTNMYSHTAPGGQHGHTEDEIEADALELLHYFEGSDSALPPSGIDPLLNGFRCLLSEHPL